jgi:hypothetical protein
MPSIGDESREITEERERERGREERKRKRERERARARKKTAMMRVCDFDTTQ